MNYWVRQQFGKGGRDSSVSLLVLFLRSYATRRSKPTPPEIPFQPKLANAVNLIGQLLTPLQFHQSPEGNAWATAVITRQESPSSPLLSYVALSVSFLFFAVPVITTLSPHFRIPLLFEGDLAHTAKCHLKLNDFIHIAGNLTTDPHGLHPQHHHHQTNIQVMVQTLNFVQGYPQLNTTTASSTTKILPFSQSEEHDINPSRKDIRAKQSEELDKDNSWKDLLDNPVEWWDLRSTEENPKGAAFERKTNGELLFISSSTPKWVQEKLELVTIDLKPEPKHSISSAKKNPDSSMSSWIDLVDNPKQWWDFRDSKQNGLVHPKHPDFKRKDGSVSLWLSNCTTFVLSKLKGLEFEVPVVKSKKAKDSKGGDVSWNDLVQNPAKWWDNRVDKRNEKAPDFKHKETGEGLWLGSSPSWVLDKLPPVKPKKGVETDRKSTLVS
ncbi:protein OSB3, chloroplastic/mitochondrial-like isoform X2 [Vigna unguiculata]|uniref:protein OSB3, chloroplastic/mitochondrial-like isoform X2 n=1 Tax=Vigna unguiculata TaxID=3917 RepID=UPI0010166785|nr:protein OSB3, chloroplastic/mitochondrial-like isoform X2 [Vigna unguiculata]